MLLLTVTDGVKELKAMEYSPLPSLSVHTSPGSKVRNWNSYPRPVEILYNYSCILLLVHIMNVCVWQFLMYSMKGITSLLWVKILIFHSFWISVIDQERRLREARNYSPCPGLLLYFRGLCGQSCSHKCSSQCAQQGPVSAVSNYVLILHYHKLIMPPPSVTGDVYS